jgi:hypothetical protein
MSTNVDEINDNSYGKLAMLYSFKPRPIGMRRVIDENWYKKFITPPTSDQSVLKIYDEEGREVLSIERNDG